MFASRRAVLGGDAFRDEYSLAFDGTNDYVALSGAFNYNVHSISVWIKVIADSDSKAIFDYRDANNDGIHLYIDDSERITYQIDNTDILISSAIPENKWHHIVATNDGSASNIYLNGVLVGTADTSGETISVSGSAIARIGTRSHTSPDNYFNGNISEVSIYNSSLSYPQVKTIYNGREPYNHKEGVSSGSLVSWWRMGDGALDKFNLIGDEKTPTTGSDLITNGTFESNITGWTAKDSSLAHETSSPITGTGSLKMTASHTSGGAYQNIGLVEGKTYNITGKMKMTSGTHGEVTIFTSASNGTGQTSAYQGSSGELTTSSGTVSFDTTIIAVDKPSIQFTCNEDSAVFLLDDVVVKEVNGNAGVMINMSSDDFTGDTP